MRCQKICVYWFHLKLRFFSRLLFPSNFFATQRGRCWTWWDIGRLLFILHSGYPERRSFSLGLGWLICIWSQLMLPHTLHCLQTGFVRTVTYSAQLPVEIDVMTVPWRFPGKAIIPSLAPASRTVSISSGPLKMSLPAPRQIPIFILPPFGPSLNSRLAILRSIIRMLMVVFSPKGIDEHPQLGIGLLDVSLDIV